MRSSRWPCRRWTGRQSGHRPASVTISAGGEESRLAFATVPNDFFRVDEIDGDPTWSAYYEVRYLWMLLCWLVPIAHSPQRSAFSDQRVAISDQSSAISDQHQSSAISDQRSAISHQRSQSSIISDQRPAISISHQCSAISDQSSERSALSAQRSAISDQSSAISLAIRVVAQRSGPRVALPQTKLTKSPPGLEGKCPFRKRTRISCSRGAVAARYCVVTALWLNIGHSHRPRISEVGLVRSPPGSHLLLLARVCPRPYVR
eukprot:1773214-Prymnesium_polylepis.1